MSGHVVPPRNPSAPQNADWQTLTFTVRASSSYKIHFLQMKKRRPFAAREQTGAAFSYCAV
jgi:hypothetical protein